MDRFHDALKYFGIPQNGLPQQLEVPLKTPGENLGVDGPEETEPTENHTSVAQDADVVDSADDGASHERMEEGKDESGALGHDQESADPAANLGAKLAELVVSEVEQEETDPRTCKTSSSDGDSDSNQVSHPERSSRNSDLEAVAQSEDASEEEAESSRKKSESELVSSRQEENSSTRDSFSSSDKSNATGPNSTVGGESDSHSAFNKTQDSIPTSEVENTNSNASQDLDSSAFEHSVENKEPESCESDGGIERTGTDSMEGESSNDIVDDGDIDYVFTFNKKILTRGEEVQLVCTNCLKEGHVCQVRLSAVTFSKISNFEDLQKISD